MGSRHKGKHARTIATALLCASLAAPTLGADAAPTKPSEDPVYRERLEVYVTDYSQFVYTPMAAVSGAPDWAPLPSALDSAISQTALEKATTYARRMNSTALIVWHKGKIALEWYGEDVTRTTPLVSKSLSKPLAAIAVGRAIALGKITSLD
ncbi:MAG: hypothetical protein VYD90_08745 [Pseudomonadota bacterium]|nr:hypothetical protein [Pseudomonadota bacterium]